MSTWSEVSLLLLSPAMSQVIQLQVTSKKTKAAIDWTWLTTFSRINFQLCSCTYSHNYYTSIYVCMCVYTLAFNAFCSICGIPYLLHSRCHVQSVHNGLSLLYGCASFKINNPPEQQCCDVGCAVLVFFSAPSSFSARCHKLFGIHLIPLGWFSVFLRCGMLCYASAAAAINLNNSPSCWILHEYFSFAYLFLLLLLLMRLV